jgi:hypothetical protein
MRNTRRRDALVLTFLAVTLLATLQVAAPAARAGGSASDLGSNGQHRRPFYIVGHNPNTLEEVAAFLDAGANALEPDVMKFSDSAVFCVGCGYINDSAGPSGLFIYHDDVLVTTRSR